MCLTVKVHAQEDYTLQIHENDTFIWEVEELNLHNFEKTFGFVPAYEEGDRIKKTVRSIEESGVGWYVTIENWDYGADWEERGKTKYNLVSSNPSKYDDNLIIPTPVNTYLEEALESLPTSYSLQDITVTKRTKEYTMVKEYDPRGIVVSEAYYDDDNILMVKVEGKFRIIEFHTNYFIGFMVISILGLVYTIISKKKYKTLHPSNI